MSTAAAAGWRVPSAVAASAAALWAAVAPALAGCRAPAEDPAEQAQAPEHAAAPPAGRLPPGAEPRDLAPEGARTRVVLLGTGTPIPDPARSGPSLAVVVDDMAYLVDLGPGVVRRAAAAQRRGVEALAPERLTRAFVTHLHSDHTLGYPDLIFTSWVMDRSEPLRVVGPPGLQEMTDHLMAAWEQDIDVRLHGSQPAEEAGLAVVVDEAAPGVVYEDERVTVRAFAVHHGAWEHAWGYRFDTPDRSVVISGDTTPTEAVVEACDGCDVLVHEVYCEEAFAAREPRWQVYHRDAHTSAVELGALAARARPALLVLVHQLTWGATDEDLLREVRDAGFDGHVVSGRDLDVL